MRARLKKRLRWALAAVFMTVCAASAVVAQSGGGTAKQLEAIRKQMETGLALFVGGKYEQAAQTFDAGYAQHPYSAFLFNAGVCYQKLGKPEVALERYREYMRIDPNAPDIDKVQRRVAALEGQRAPPPQPPAVDGGAGDAGEAGAPPPPPPPPPAEEIPDTEDAMRSLVVVETDPPGAPLKVFERTDPSAKPFMLGEANPGWRQAVTTVSPTSLSLAVGHYQIVVDKFRDFNVSQTTIEVSAGHVYHFKANLSQGAFMSFLRVSANVKGAHIWLDDPTKKRPEWGTTPYGELVASGEHDVLVEAPGFQPLKTKIGLSHGEQKELEVRLVRVGYGIVRFDADAPEVSVRIDNKPKGVWRSGEPALDVEVPAGSHELSVRSSGYKTLTTQIDVPRGLVLPVHAKMVPRPPRGAAWTEAVLSAAFFGAGTFLGLESRALYDQVDDDRRAGLVDRGDNRIKRGRLYAVGADVGFAAGGLFAVLSTINFIKDPLPDSSSKLDEPVEFDDPIAERPKAEAQSAKPTTRKRPSRPAPSRLRIGPAVVGRGGGIVIGGSF